MNPKTLIILLFFILAVVLAVVAAFLPAARGVLGCLALACLAFGLFLERLPA